jgi:DNA invertase Pin-like site-specific DNA recombinase
MLIGYARVSTHDQDLDLQRDALKASGCDKIFEEKVSGTADDRPELDRAFDQLRKDDVLVVWKLDRLAGSLKPLLVRDDDRLKRAEAGIRCLNPHMDTTTPEGRLFFSITGAFAEFEREIIRQRTNAGLKAALARGRKGGRPRKLDEAGLAKAKAMMSDPTISIAAIAAVLGVSRSTLYAALPNAPRFTQSQGNATPLDKS